MLNVNHSTKSLEAGKGVDIYNDNIMIKYYDDIMIKYSNKHFK